MASQVYLDFGWVGSPRTGEYAAPYNTMLEAVAAVDDNGTIVIKNGSYICEGQNWGSTVKNITIQSESVLGVTLTTPTYISYWTGAGSIILKNIRFVGTATETVTHIFYPGSNADGDLTVNGCEFVGFTLSRGVFNWPIALSNIYFNNCIINVDTSAVYTSLIFTAATSDINVEIKKCIIVTNYASSMSGRGTLSISDSIVYSKNGSDRTTYGADWVYSATATMLLENNNCYYNIANHDAYGTNITNANPMFLDMKNNNFKLPPHSPLIGIGTY